MRSSKPQKAQPPPSEFRLVVGKKFLEDLQYWNRTDAKVVQKVVDLMVAVRRHPFGGTGKPEPLKWVGPGMWSRRISGEHRFVYRVDAGDVHLLQCRYHY